MASSNNWVRLGTAAVTTAVLLVGIGLIVALTRDETPSVPVRAFFVGDSYTAGSAMDSGKQWPDYLAEEHGWIATDLGVGGSGYAVDGLDGTRYADRIEPSGIDTADLVMISGGLNDISKAPSASVSAAVVDTLQLIDEAASTEATVVVLSPFIVSQSERAKRMEAALTDAAAQIGAEYLQVSDFLLDNPQYIGDDGTHPTDEGHRALARFIDPMLPNDL